MLRVSLAIYSSLELLTADFARKFADAGFLIQLDTNGFLMVAKKAWEIRWKRLFLHPTYERNHKTMLKGDRLATPTFFGPCGFREDFLRLP